MPNVPEHLRTGKHDDKAVKMNRKKALAPWESALSDPREREERKSLNCLDMQGTWKACEEDELNYKAEMEGIRETRDNPGRVASPAYVEEIMKTFPKGYAKPTSDMQASVLKQCEYFTVWAIGATTGAVSQRHRDAVGAFTYLIVHSGRKLWIMREGHHDAPYQNDVVELGPGDLLIMAPGIEHFVYTIESSFCTGGHFYLMKHLGDTLNAKRDDWLTPGNIGTNQCVGFSYAYMVWYGFELLRPKKELKEIYGLLKHEVTTLRQSMREFLALPVVEGLAKIREGEERKAVEAVLFYMLDQAAILAQELEKEGFVLPVEKEKEASKSRKRRKEGATEGEGGDDSSVATSG